MNTFLSKLDEPVDAASSAAFRVLFGMICTWSASRFLYNDWVERCFGQPRFFFHYYGFAWIRPMDVPSMNWVFVFIAVCGILVSLGLIYRIAATSLFVSFTYVELCDVTNYLNHYYLVSLVAFLCALLPLNRFASLDAKLFPSLARQTVPRWVLCLLRFQIGVVYFYAGLAKANSDWLFYAQPLSIWLRSRTDTPFIGQFFETLEIPYLMSWAGFLYDTSIPLWLSIPRVRPWAYVVLIAFHGMTSLLFPIGLFPVIMTGLAAIYFDPSWPRSLLRLKGFTAVESSTPTTHPRMRPGMRIVRNTALALYAAVQIFVPLRTHLYGGNVSWHEQGMRWSWRVMLREKNGAVTFRVRSARWSYEKLVSPDEYLVPLQEREMSGQPDLILQLAHRIARDFRKRGVADVEVRADALVSLNGRRMAPLIDPTVDLAKIQDGFAKASWILPEPQGPPRELRSRSLFGF